MTVIGNYKN